MVSGIAAETTTQESLKKIPTPQELGRAARRSKKNKKNTKRQVSREFEPLNSAEVAVSASHLQSANSKPQKSIPEAIEESLKRAHSESTISSPTTHEAVVDSDIQAVRDSEKANQPFENLSIPDTFPREASLQTIPPLSKGMTRTLGYIRRSGNFVNFFGVGVWSSIVKRFTPTDMTSAWPSFGSVSFNYDNIKVTDSAFYILDWQETDLVNSTSNSVTADGRKSYQYRIEYNPHTCYEAKDANVYLVAYPIEENPDLNQKVMVKFQRTAADDDLESSRLLHFKNIHVLLAVGDRYYGPVKLLEDSANRPYANLQLGAKKGLVPGYIRAKDPTYLISVPETCWSEQGYRFTIFVDLAFTNAMEPKFFDLLSEKDLLLRLSSSIAPTKESQEQFSQWVDNHLATNELFCDDPEIRRARKQKIMLALEQSQNTEQFLDGVVSLASQTIDRRVDDEAFFDALVKKITEDPSLMKRLESHRIVAAQLNVQEEKLAQATARYERISNEIENNLKTAQEKAIKDNKTLLAQNKLLAEDVRKKQEKLGILDEVKDLATTRNKIAEEVSSLQQKRNELENLTSRIDDHLTEAVNNPHKYAFDGALASRLLSAASTWEAGKQNDNFVDRARAIATVKFNPLSGLELADDLVQKVQMYRAYDRDTILNFFILLTQNFLTIFSGPPGVGKTSICEILAHVLGLSYFNHHLTDEQQNLWSSPLGMSRYLPVSVERGWTSKRDFVGYYNPLSKTFESVDPLRREAFAQLDAEKNLKLDKIPFIMLLDEANLSPMEHYWGDFMRLCDKHSKAMSYVALGGNSQYSVPDTLRFVATINNDFTTENLSPRLLDRASIVTLPNLDGQPGVMPTENDICLPVSWQALQDLFGAQDLPDTNNDIRDLLTETYQRFSTLGMPVSMRTQIAIKDYVSVATKLFSSEENPSFTSAVDFAVIQRLFPRINGNGEQYRKQLESLHSFLESNGLGRSSHLLEKLIDTGKASMDWYHFL